MANRRSPAGADRSVRHVVQPLRRPAPKNAPFPAGAGGVAPTARSALARWEDAVARETPILVTAGGPRMSRPILAQLGFREVCEYQGSCSTSTFRSLRVSSRDREGRPCPPGSQSEPFPQRIASPGTKAAGERAVVSRVITGVEPPTMGSVTDVRAAFRSCSTVPCLTRID